MSKFNIKSFDQIQGEIFKQEGIDQAIKDKLSEIETIISEALIEKKNKVAIFFRNEDFSYMSFSGKTPTLFIAYRVIEILSQKKYSFVFKKINNEVQLLFDFSKKSTFEKDLEDFFSKPQKVNF